MTEEKNHQSEKAKALDRLIREIDQPRSPDFIRPDDKIILAYLAGEATQSQKELIWAAFDASPAFRKEVLEIAKEMEEFSSKETANRASKMELNDVPVKLLRMNSRPIWKTAARILVPIAALVLLVPIAMIYMNQKDAPDFTSTTEIAQLELYNQELDPGLLVKMHPRGANDIASAKTYPTPDKAALAEFRFLLEYEDGQFKFVSEIPQPSPNANTRVLQLRLQDDTGQIIKEFTAVVPKFDTTSAPIEAWILNLPSRSLYKIDMSQDTVAVKLNKEQISKGCVTFTYGGDNWFKSTFGFIYNFEEAK